MLKANLSKNWTTHMGVLVSLVLASRGDVVEFGSGPFSTPLLHWMTKAMGRKFLSFESSFNFYNYARQFRSKTHSVKYVRDWDKVDVNTKRAVAFVDNGTERRKIDALRLKNSVDYIVLHNTKDLENDKTFLSQFKNVYTWKECQPWVTILSNSKSLNRFKA